MGGLIGTGRTQATSAIKSLEDSAVLERQREQSNKQLKAAYEAKTTSMIGAGVGGAIQLAPKAYSALTSAPAATTPAVNAATTAAPAATESATTATAAAATDAAVTAGATAAEIAAAEAAATAAAAAAATAAAGTEAGVGALALLALA